MKTSTRAVNFRPIGVILVLWILLIVWGMPSKIARAQGAASETPTIAPSSTATKTPAPTVTPTATLSVEDRLTILEDKVNHPSKDDWDKLNSASGLLGFLGSLITSGLLVWIIHRATQAFNQRQLKSEEDRDQRELASEEKRAERESKIAEIQTVQSFIPQLASNDPRVVESSLLAIAGLGNETLAARLAELYRTDGAIMALNKMVASGNTKASDAAEQSLGAIFKTPMRSIVQVACEGKVFGAGFFIRADGLIVTTQNVISRGGEITITMPQGTLPATLIAQDVQANLAILKVAGTVFNVMPIHQANTVDLLSDLFLIGYDPQIGLIVTPGKVVGQNPSPEYPCSELINVNVLVPRSYGGAVAIDREGSFIGMVVLLRLDDSGNATTAYVLPAASLAEFVKNLIPQ